MTTETLEQRAMLWLSRATPKEPGKSYAQCQIESLVKLLQSVHAQGRRKGAEEMRERAAKQCDPWAVPVNDDEFAIVQEIRHSIRSLPTTPENAREGDGALGEEESDGR